MEVKSGQVSTLDEARVVLGVSPEATLEEVRAAYLGTEDDTGGASGEEDTRVPA